MLRGLWSAHVGWMFDPFPEALARYAADLRADRMLRVINALFPLWAVLGLLLPGAVAGAVTGSWTGALLGVLWGGLVRICLVHHLTWSINSVCHVWGSRPYATRDESRNNVFFGVMAFGEGWHNNHHAFPTSARHGLRWWQLDVTWLVVRLLSMVGLTWNLRIPTPERVAAKAR
jgi:stearoyl-CoA desaturase (delta-9 desaturase)